MIKSTLSVFDDQFLQKTCPTFFFNLLSIQIEKNQKDTKIQEEEKLKLSIIKPFLINLIIQVSFFFLYKLYFNL